MFDSDIYKKFISNKKYAKFLRERMGHVLAMLCKQFRDQKVNFKTKIPIFFFLLLLLTNNLQ